MKQLLLVLIFTLSGSIKAQELAMNTPLSPMRESVSDTEKGLAGKVEKSYVFDVYGAIPERKSTFEEEHFLGKDITRKWNSFNENYVQTYQLSVGFSGSTVEILKPSIYHAVLKVNKYIKKSTKKKSMSKEEAAKVLSHILDCANVMSIEETTTFEQAIQQTEEIEKIIELFAKVELRFM